MAPQGKPLQGLPRAQVRSLADFKGISYGEMARQVKELQEKYPDFVKVTTAQEAYGLESPGSCDDVDGKTTPCVQYIVTITDFASLPDPERPEVFLSGSVHGDERVGPSAVLAATALMVKAADCVRRNCQDSGLPWSTLEWLAGLVRSRVVVMMPAANALGFNDNRREENGMDPNRDFPFTQDPRECMQTIAARSINEVWREHLFQLSLTFHGGMESITYEWGAMNHRGEDAVSPDDTAQAQITTAMSEYAGRFGSTPQYMTGITNEVVYPVPGGFEDWAYAGSWDNELSPPPPNHPLPVRPCTPKTYGGYPPEKTTYDNVTLRAFNILIETSNIKGPPNDMMGNDAHLWEANGQGSGHVTRNVRLTLAAIDLAQPYVSWAEHSGAGCFSACQPAKAHVSSTDQLELKWRVGGAVNIDETELLWGVWPSAAPPARRLAACPVCAGGDMLAATESQGKTGKQTGHGRWRKDDGDDENRRMLEENTAAEQIERLPGLSDPIFKAKLDDPKALELLKGGKDLFVVARAKVDQSWSVNKRHDPDVAPQSHIVNARTNPDWHVESHGKVIKGRVDWYSPPLRLSWSDANKGGMVPSSQSQPPRNGAYEPESSTGMNVPGLQPTDATDNAAPPSMRTLLKGFGVTVVMVGVLAAIMAVIWKVRARIRARRTGPNRRANYAPVVTMEVSDLEVEMGTLGASAKPIAS